MADKFSAEAEFIKANYGWAGLTFEKKIKGASSVLTFFSDTQGANWILKQSFWYGFCAEPLRAIETIYQTGAELLKRGAAVQTAIQNKRGGFAENLNGAPTVVLPYLVGAKFSSANSETLAMGDSLGFFHQAGKKYLDEFPEKTRELIKTIPVEKPYEESRQLYKKALRAKLLENHNCSQSEVCQAVKDNIELLDAAIEFVDAQFAAAGTLAVGILHNDFSFENIIFPKNSPPCLLDIDQLSIGNFIWDIGKVLITLSSEALNNKKFKLEKIAAAILKKCHEINPLPMKEYLLAVPAAQRWDVMRILRTLRRHRFENDRLPELMPKLKTRFLPRLKALPQILSFWNENWLTKIL